MLRRLSVALLALAVVAGGVASCPCIVKACAIAKAMPMDCCNDGEHGISAPDCCPGGTQLSRQDASPAATAPVRDLISVAQQIVPAAVALIPPTLPLVVRVIDPGAAPPGGPLIAQHTSLLL